MPRGGRKTRGGSSQSSGSKRGAFKSRDKLNKKYLPQPKRLYPTAEEQQQFVVRSSQRKLL